MMLGARERGSVAIRVTVHRVAVRTIVREERLSSGCVTGPSGRLDTPPSFPAGIQAR